MKEVIPKPEFTLAKGVKIVHCKTQKVCSDLFCYDGTVSVEIETVHALHVDHSTTIPHDDLHALVGDLFERFNCRSEYFIYSFSIEINNLLNYHYNTRVLFW